MYKCLTFLFFILIYTLQILFLPQSIIPLQGDLLYHSYKTHLLFSQPIHKFFTTLWLPTIAPPAWEEPTCFHQNWLPSFLFIKQATSKLTHGQHTMLGGTNWEKEITRNQRHQNFMWKTQRFSSIGMRNKKWCLYFIIHNHLHRRKLIHDCLGLIQMLYNGTTINKL